MPLAPPERGWQPTPRGTTGAPAARARPATVPGGGPRTRVPGIGPRTGVPGGGPRTGVPGTVRRPGNGGCQGAVLGGCPRAVPWSVPVGGSRAQLSRRPHQPRLARLARRSRRRDGGTAGRRDGGTAGRRDGGTAGRRDGGTAGRRDGGTLAWKFWLPRKFWATLGYQKFRVGRNFRLLVLLECGGGG
jgi:hypothetical protein